MAENRFWRRLIAFFFPERCAFCTRVIDAGDICAECRKKLPYHRGVEKHIEFVNAYCAPLFYRTPVRQSLLRYKFHGKRSYCRAYAELMERSIREELGTGFDLITWVPISQKRLRKRGYDQSELLARELSRRLNLPVEATLRKTRDNKKQSTLEGRSQRAANVSGVYAVLDKERIRGKRLLLIDDILTTGATASECARTLLMARAEEVSCASVAHAMRKK